MRGMQGEHEKLTAECAAQSEELSSMGTEAEEWQQRRWSG